jgi:hypothetical protein
MDNQGRALGIDTCGDATIAFATFFPFLLCRRPIGDCTDFPGCWPNAFTASSKIDSKEFKFCNPFGSRTEGNGRANCALGIMSGAEIAGNAPCWGLGVKTGETSDSLATTGTAFKAALAAAAFAEASLLMLIRWSRLQGHV